MGPISVANDDGDETWGSAFSMGRYEKRNFKNLLPQITSSMIAVSPSLDLGLSLAFSAIMIPQLQDKDSDIQVTSSQASWIASVFVIVLPFGALLNGYLMDRFGRLNTLKWSTLPGILGWLALIFSRDVPTILIGRLLQGLSSSMSSGASVVYITEIARKDMRGSLLSLGPTLASLGMVLTFIKGWLIGWRMTSWFGLIYQIIPLFLMFLIDESPVYLISKNRSKEAKRSLLKLHRHQPRPGHGEESFADLQLQLLLRERRETAAHAEATGGVNKMAEFMKPTGYKPLLILAGLFFFQQFSGVYVFLFYSVQLLEDVGTSFNPYAASIMISAIRMVMSLINTWMLTSCKRRLLVMLSGTGMALCALTSGLFTYLIKNDLSNAHWVPVVFLILYTVSSMVGLLNIPWTMTAELFPLEIRGTAHSITICVVYCIMFVAIQNYANMTIVFGGVAGVQLFFASMSIGAVVFTALFLPETHGKKLVEIQKNFNGGSGIKKHLELVVK